MKITEKKMLSFITTDYENKRQKVAKTMLLAIATLLSSSTLVYSYVPIQYAMAQGNIKWRQW
jgi:hypothetical protein